MGKIVGWRLEPNGVLQVFNVSQPCSCSAVANDSLPDRVVSPLVGSLRAMSRLPVHCVISGSHMHIPQVLYDGLLPRAHNLVISSK